MLQVEDEWERELESEEDLNVLFVEYDSAKISLEEILRVVREHDFEVKVREQASGN